jgi:FK506-binding nuclear protein
MILACAAASGAQQPATEGLPDSLTNADFAPALGVDLARFARLAPGVYARDVATGEGDSVRVGARLALHFRIRRLDGVTVADVHTDGQSQPWLPGRYLRGMEVGLRGMRAGGRRQLVVPAALAYGANAGPSLPANTPLVIDLALDAVR